MHHDDPYGIHVSGDVVTVEIAFEGETEAGVPAAWEAVDVFHLVDGRVKRLTTWYDLDEVVGLLRDPGVPEKRLALLLDRARARLAPDDASVTREAPRPERARVVLRGGGEVSAADWAERVELWRRAIRAAGDFPTLLLPLPPCGGVDAWPRWRCPRRILVRRAGRTGAAPASPSRPTTPTGRWTSSPSPRPDPSRSAASAARASTC